MLFETFVTEDKIKEYNKYFGGFQITWLPAIKNHQKGRASGGAVYGIRKSNELSITFSNFGEKYVIKVGEDRRDRHVCTIIPLYLNDSFWNRDFEEIRKLLEVERVEKVIIMGDCNVRIGEMQQIPEEWTLRGKLTVNRKSKDKSVNQRGIKFIEFVEEQGGVIVNGRTKEDCEGELTFISHNGTSVNDICVMTYESIPLLKDFKVGSQIFSDHQPIELTVEIRQTDATESENTLLPKIIWTRRDVQEYATKIERSLIQVNFSGQPENSLENLKSAIKSSASMGNITTKNYQVEKKQDWFDRECAKARHRSFRLLNLFRRNNSELRRTMYLNANKKYKELCTTKQRMYFDSIARSLKDAKDSKQFWTIVKRLSSCKHKTIINARLADLTQHFSILLNPPSNSINFSFAEPYIQDDSLDAPFTYDELERIISKTKDNKAPGQDGIPNEFYKNAPRSLIEKMVYIFNEIYESAQIPSCFRKAIIFPIYKKGDPENPANYRGLSFLNSEAKIFAGVLTQRLVEWMEANGVLTESQAGFRKKYSTTDNLFNLMSIIQLRFAEKKSTYSFFVDFQAAFDNVNRKALLYKLQNLGVSSKFMMNVKSLYKEGESAVWDGSKLSHWFCTDTGVRQGCPFSPVLFCCFINDLPEYIGGGVQIARQKINVLMYADDVVLLAERPEELQCMIEKLEKYCHTWNLKLNLEKSKIMIFQRRLKRRREDERWSYKGNEIEVVKEYKYLGITLTHNLNMKTHFKERYKSALYGINSTWNTYIQRKDVPLTAKYRVFESVARAVICYGVQIWGFKNHDEIEKLHRYFLKKLFWLPRNTPNYVLYLETGLNPMYVYTLYANATYIRRVLQYHQDRLPHILAKEVIERNTYWFEEWKTLAARFNVDINGEHITSLPDQLFHTCELIKQQFEKDAKEAARLGTRHDLYCELDYTPKSYMSDEYSIKFMSTILKARSGLLNLNANPFQTSRSYECMLCNKNEPENITHFLGKCPMLLELRKIFFGKNYLELEEVINELNGKNWNLLYSYIEKALKYRQWIVDIST